MPYTLYTDKNENFVCEVSVKNASLKDAFTRMIVESDGVTLMFKGQLKDGKCVVPINRLKGLLSEGSSGKMHLEMVVEDTYFKPWESEYVVEQFTAVKVQVEEQTKKTSKKPIVEVKAPQTSSQKLSIPASDIVFICERVGITREKLAKNSSEFHQVVKAYFKENVEHIPKSKGIIREALSALK